MQTVGRLSEVAMVSRVIPDKSLLDYEAFLEGRKFTRWYKRNKKVIHRLAIAVPAFTFSLFGLDPISLSSLFLPPIMPPLAVPAIAGGESFMDGHGVILLHMLIIGFLTLVVSTFLKFTGRGDLVPLIAFVGGGAILYEVIGMFKDIYLAVAGFLSM